jgi:hypothetical protein
MSGIRIPTIDLNKKPLDPDTQALVRELRTLATSLESGVQINAEKPRVRNIVDLVLKLAGVAAPMRMLVVGSKYLR